MFKRSIFVGIILLASGVVAMAETPVPTTPTSTSAAEVVHAITVDKIAVGTAIDNREISGEAKTFEASVAKLYCWTRIHADQAPISMKHLWSVDGTQEAEVPLTLQSASGRTWSSKNVRPGSWKVNVVDDAGNVLATESFSVGSSVP